MMKRYFVSLLLAMVVAAITATGAWAHFQSYSSVRDDGANEFLIYALETSASSRPWAASAIANATSNATNSWDALDCAWAGCPGVNFSKTTPAVCATADKCVDYKVYGHATATSVCGQNVYACYYFHSGVPDEIILDLTNMNTLTADKQRQVLLHETGHSLGLAHAPCATYKGVSVMVPLCYTGLSKWGSHDKQDYARLWVTYNGPGSFAFTSDEGDTESVQTSDGFIIAD